MMDATARRWLRRTQVLFLTAAAALIVPGCGSRIADEAKAAGKTAADFPPDAHDYFAQMDMVAANPDDAGPPQLVPLALSPDEIKGRNTWMLWTGGNERFWDWLAGNGYAFLDLLKLVDFNPANRWPRFRDAGLIVEPGTRAPVGPDAFGLWIREAANPGAPAPNPAVFGRSSGIIGLRLYPNPKFDDVARSRWSIKRYYEDPAYYSDPKLVRPYRVGMTCAICHVSPHPLNPPPDVEQPEWSHLSATVGNQYFKVKKVFGNLLQPDSLVYHLLESEPPGTIDTSLIASDNINNPNTMNAIWEVAGRLDRSGYFAHRPAGYAEAYKSRYGTSEPETVSGPARNMPVLLYSTEGYRQEDCGREPASSSYGEGKPGPQFANPRQVPRILLDGSDSIGAWGALARVYLNIGTYSERWNRLHNPILGFRSQGVFSATDASENSVFWRATDCLVDDMAKYFLKSTSPTRLRNAPGGRALVKGSGLPWTPELAAGRRVFAENCIVCHSSKQPARFDSVPAEKLRDLLQDAEYRKWAHEEVEKPDFWRENYLSTDRRVPVSLVKTNAARAVGSNAIAGNMWADFSSDTYKQLPAVPAITVWNPFPDPDSGRAGGGEERWTPPGGGRGYYRPASLVSVWATAPLLHNNSVGVFNADPSVSGRVAAFRDAIAKLLVRGANEGEAAQARWAMGSDLNGATPERLKADHGLIWRTPQPTWVRIPAPYLPILIASTTGLPRGLISRPWILPLILTLFAAALLFTRRRIVRVLGYVLLVVAIAAGAVGLKLAGRFGGVQVGPFPQGLPVNSIANLDSDRPLAVGRALFRAHGIMREIEKLPPGSAEAARKRDEMGAILQKVSRNPDMVMDRGHYFAAHLSERELQDLIDLLMTF